MLRKGWAESIIFAGSLLLFSCAPVRLVVPPPEESVRTRMALSVSAGGPGLKMFGVIFPTPSLSVAFHYPIQRTTIISAGIDLTSALFGVLHTDISGTFFLFWTSHDRRGYGAISPRIFLLYHGRGGWRIFPQVDIVGILPITSRWFAYGGIQNMLEFQRIRAHEDPQSWVWLPAFVLGIHRKTQSAGWWQIEWVGYMPWVETRFRAVEWLPLPGGWGALGLRLTFSPGWWIPLRRTGSPEFSQP